MSMVSITGPITEDFMKPLRYSFNILIEIPTYHDKFVIRHWSYVSQQQIEELIFFFLCATMLVYINAENFQYTENPMEIKWPLSL